MVIPKIPPIAAIYTRRSRDKGDEFSSCDAQFEICNDFLVREGWTGSGIRYDDEGESGERLDRPGLSALAFEWRPLNQPANNFCFAASDSATTAGCLSLRSTEIA